MAEKEYNYTNNLIEESSPYLLQHAHNPVNWQAWNDKSLAKAKRENKLIIVSIGYSACHWCHVMEHESFENKEIAAFMNDHFISIKVDREERPDIDQIYMNAVQLLSGRGGWPLNCIALPDGRPIYGGTYFPPEQWLDILKKVAAFVEQNPKETEEQAAKLSEGIQMENALYTSPEASEYLSQDLDAIFEAIHSRIDSRNGGFQGAPKFPLPIGYQLMLHYNYHTKNTEALDAVNTTLHKMAEGGIYDQIGGGFARYSTDANWKVPHFEKMLYDNGQLVSLYAMAFQKTKDPVFESVVKETLAFTDRELLSPDGGFYAALDADSEGVEGKYYTWQEAEIRTILGKNAEQFIAYYNISEEGNWEHGNNIPFRSGSSDRSAKKQGLETAQFIREIEKSKKKLLKLREERIRPGLDDKILTSWNAIMLKGYIDAYRAVSEEKYLQTAIRIAQFISANMRSNIGGLFRTYKNGTAKIAGFLDDYAFTISAYISLYQATFNERWLNEARSLTAYVIEHFSDKRSGLFFYTSDLDPALIARKIDVSDNVIPSANSEMAKNLFLLGSYYYMDEYIQRSKDMLGAVREHTMTGGVYYANWDILMAWFIHKPFEIAIVGPDANKLKKDFDRHYLPDVIFLGSKQEGHLDLLKNKYIEGQTMIYVCRDKQCQMPTKDIDMALSLLD